MKNSGTLVLCFCFVLSAFYSQAQNRPVPINEPDYNKPKLFRNLPDTIVVNTAILNNLLGSEAGRSVNANLSADFPFQFQGEVLSRTSMENNSTDRSVVLSSSNYNGARFTLSQITNQDGTTRYVGRIISFQHGDLFELQKQKGQYILVKKNFYDLVNE